MSIQLNRLEKVSDYVDGVVSELEQVARNLESKMNALLASGTEEGLTDLALARANVERLMVESGYYRVTDKLLDEGYQSFIDMAHESYLKQYGKSLQYSDVSLNRLEQVKQLSADNFNTIAEDNINQLQKVMVDYQFGAIDKRGAAERLSQILGPDFAKYSETVVRATATAFDRESSNLMALDGGLKMFKYVGPLDPSTSDFCEEMLGKGEMEWKDWQAIDNPGGYPVTIYGGHPRCRHALVPTGE